MSKYHTLKVKEVRLETEDTVSVSIDVPDGLKEEFSFIQGQHVTLKASINGEDVARSYSLCSSPFDGEWRVAIKKVKDGAFSTFANTKLNVGDSLEVMPPIGHFNTLLDSSHKKNYVAFASGSGITPIISIIKTTLETEPHSSFTLYYGNRSVKSIIFKEDLEAIKNRFMGRFSIYHILSRETLEVPLFNGRIDQTKCESLFRTLLNLDDTDEVFICGPEPMIHAVKESLELANYPSERVHFELFTSPVGSLVPTDDGEIREEVDPTKFSRVEVKIDGKTFEFKLAYGGDNILDAAIAEGADVPFSCKGGVCMTCVAKLKKGKVDMDVNYALEPEEVDDGLVLACQSHPRSEEIFIDFDAH